MINWVKALLQEFVGKSPVEQIEQLKKIGVLGIIGALGVGGYNIVFAKDKNDGSEKFTLRAVIKDPDGFTYVRSMPNREGQIVATVKDKEIFFTYVQNSNWWQIKTHDHRYGFIHLTRIQVLN